MIHAASVADNIDEREDALIAKVEEIIGKAMITVENKSIDDEEEHKKKVSRAKAAWNYVWGNDNSDLRALEESEEGKQLKRALGIEGFTTPSQLLELYHILTPKAAVIEGQLENEELDDDVRKELEKELNRINNRILEIRNLAIEGISDELTAEEAQLLKEFKDSDPTGFANHGAELETLLKDIRKLRARRHEIIDLYNTLADPITGKPKIQMMEDVVNDARQNDAYHYYLNLL